MNTLTNEIFDLMVQLTNLKEPEDLIRTFIEEVNLLTEHFSVKFSDEKPSEDIFCFEINTRHTHMGYGTIHGNIRKNEKEILSKSFQLLNSLLEKAEGEK